MTRMSPSIDVAGVLVIMVAVFAVSWLLPDRTARLMGAALVIVIGGGILAYLRRRASLRR
jgi:hypothetical protein